MTLMGSIMHGYQYSIDIHKNPMFMACHCAWRGALKFISNEEQKCQIYHTLHTLLDEEEEDNNYEILFNKFMTLIDNNESTQCFAKYFK